MDDKAEESADRQIGRFTLHDLVEERFGAKIWRAVDSTLNREVALWLIPADESLAADLGTATRTAATITDRRIVHILDVFPHEDLLVVVTEWGAGQILGHHLSAPLPAEEAARIAFETACAIEAAHAGGIAHGRLRPSNILVGDGGEVRVIGLGIDAVVAGIDEVAGEDPVAADVNGIGSILYACLTSRWPNGDVSGVPGAPQVAGQTPPPARLLADVPESLNDFCVRTVISIGGATAPDRLRSAGQAREILGAHLTDLTGQRRTLTRSKDKSSPSVLALSAVGAAVVLLVALLVWGGQQLLSSDQSSTAAQPTVAGTPTTSPDTGASRPPRATRYRVVDGRDFDPLGNGEENPDTVPDAFDRDRSTAWRTVTYYDKGLDNKPGVGILLDLGAPRTIGTVTLFLVGNGTDLQVLTSNAPPGELPQDYDLMAQATEAGERVRLKAADPTSARYVLVWMTGLPQVDGGWRGGVREVRVTS